MAAAGTRTRLFMRSLLGIGAILIWASAVTADCLLAFNRAGEAVSPAETPRHRCWSRKAVRPPRNSLYFSGEECTLNPHVTFKPEVRPCDLFAAWPTGVGTGETSRGRQARLPVRRWISR